ncbi:MAG: hypothetical protein WCS35_09850, partial [Sphaerochaeta sp.]
YSTRTINENFPYGSICVLMEVRPGRESLKKKRRRIPLSVPTFNDFLFTNTKTVSSRQPKLKGIVSSRLSLHSRARGT